MGSRRLDPCRSCTPGRVGVLGASQVGEQETHLQAPVLGPSWPSHLLSEPRSRRGSAHLLRSEERAEDLSPSDGRLEAGASLQQDGAWGTGARTWQAHLGAPPPHPGTHSHEEGAGVAAACWCSEISPLRCSEAKQSASVTSLFGS